jgi:hypothetical protein
MREREKTRTNALSHKWPVNKYTASITFTEWRAKERQLNALVKLTVWMVRPWSASTSELEDDGQGAG